MKIPETHLYKICTSKISYSRKKFASQVIGKMKHSKGLNPYQCLICKKWHIGHIKEGL